MAKELNLRPGALLDRVRGDHERILIVRNGRPCAALVPVADLERLERTDKEAAK